MKPGLQLHLIAELPAGASDEDCFHIDGVNYSTINFSVVFFNIITVPTPLPSPSAMHRQAVRAGARCELRLPVFLWK